MAKQRRVVCECAHVDSENINAKNMTISTLMGNESIINGDEHG